MEPNSEPVDIVVKRDDAVTITFADGHVGRLSIMELRLGCPCATCRSLRDRDEPSWPRPGSPTPLRIIGAELYGAWGLQITWNDDHATGIFPFDVLRRNAQPVTTPTTDEGAPDEETLGEGAADGGA